MKSVTSAPLAVLAAVEKARTRLEPIKTVNYPGPGVETASFNQKLEKHLGDVRSGKAELSKFTARELKSRNAANFSLFSENSPQAQSLYGAYQTAFGYGQKARFIQGVKLGSEPLLNAQQITAAYQRQLEEKE